MESGASKRKFKNNIMINEVKIGEVKPNAKNPRVIKDERFKQLVKSIERFPEMLNKRPLVVVTALDGKYEVLGGNMRLAALKHLKKETVPVIVADDWSEEQRTEFLIADNVGFGEWDWDMLANEWNTAELDEWGLTVWQPETEVDYSLLDSELDGQLADMAGGVKKAIQIEFEPDHYEEAYALVKFWRERGAYVGSMIMEYLKSEKEKI